MAGLPRALSGSLTLPLQFRHGTIVGIVIRGNP
jgi:hypothetical protein